MISKVTLRLIFIGLALGATALSLAMNRVRAAEVTYLGRPQVEAIIRAGGGEVIFANASDRLSLANVVTFQSQGCLDPIYALPDRFTDGAYLILASVPGLDITQYHPQIAYNSDIGPPVKAVWLHLRRTVLNLSELTGSGEIRHSKAAIYFLVPNKCSITHSFAWQELWVSG